MAARDGKETVTRSSNAAPSRTPKPPNPVWRMMGLPNFRLKLPSRNWLIFLTITGSWSAAVYYDRREKRRIQRKWTKLVEPFAQEPINTHELPRKVTVFLSAPPGDGLVPARDHFNEYIKPILVAAALDWDAVEGRREGDVRADLAERIRRLRKRRGEPTEVPLEVGTEDLLEESRSRSGVETWKGTAGDIVIGRHAWKEYVRGLHEGWLGPLDLPAQPVLAQEIPANPSMDSKADTQTPIQPTSDNEIPTNTSESASGSEQLKEEQKKEGEGQSKKKSQPPPFNTPADYSTSVLSPNCPPELGPSTCVPLPHLLGFFNFPIRMYRFLNRRQVADDIGRQTAAAVFAAYRPFGASDEFAASPEVGKGPQWEQQRLLAHEEAEWHKSVRERKDDNGKERVWLDDMVLDSRVAERMRKFELERDVEERSNRQASDGITTWWASIWPKGEKKKAAWEGLTDDLD